MAKKGRYTAEPEKKCHPAEKDPLGCKTVDADTPLGSLICDSTPYAKMYMLEGWQCEVEWDAVPTQWSFRGTNARVAKALRIPVLVAVWNDKTCRHEYYKDWLLVGYEGGGGY